MEKAPPVELFVRKEGEGSAIVLLHGIGGDHSVWNAIVPRLAVGHQVLAPDLRGHGRSPFPPESSMGFPELAGDVIALLDREKVDRAHVVGMSAGHCDAHTRGIGQRWADTYREEGFDAFALRILKDLYYPDWIEAHLDVADRLRDSLRDRDLTGVLRWGESVRSFDLRGRLTGLRPPTLVVQGMDDHVVDPSHARLLRQTIAGTQVRLLAQTGHMVPVERPDETLEAIQSWTARADSQPSP